MTELEALRETLKKQEERIKELEARDWLIDSGNDVIRQQSEYIKKLESCATCLFVYEFERLKPQVTMVQYIEEQQAELRKGLTLRL